MIGLDPRTTALVLIDLQEGIVGRSLAPRAGAEVVQVASGLAGRFRAAGAPVILLNVGWSADSGDLLRQPVDRPIPRPEGGLPPGWSDLVPGVAAPTDIRVTKHQWGAFYGTDLDVQLRRRGIRAIVLGGIATNFGVESTARQAYEHGYEVVIVEDATTSVAADMHAFAVARIFPLIGRVVAAAEVDLGVG